VQWTDRTNRLLFVSGSEVSSNYSQYEYLLSNVAKEENVMHVPFKNVNKDQE
jgi:hypothetical protein